MARERLPQWKFDTVVQMNATDASIGAKVGDTGFVIGDGFYECQDNTTGAAVWVPVTPASDSWAAVLSVGQVTDGDMPVLQEPTAGFDPLTTARDQIHAHWSGGTTPGGPDLPRAGVGLAVPTASYVVPVFATLNVTGASGAIQASLLVEPPTAGTQSCLVSLQVGVRVGTIPGTAQGFFNHRTVRFSPNFAPEVFENYGDTDRFDVVQSGGQVVAQYLDNFPAVGQAIVHGHARVTVMNESLSAP